MKMISKKYVTDCEGHNEFYEKYHKEGKKRILVTDKVHFEINGEDFIPPAFSVTGNIVWYKKGKTACLL
jgi:hypothetical protein